MFAESLKITCMMTFKCKFEAVIKLDSVNIECIAVNDI